MAVTIQLRGDTAANWTSVNPVLAQRELAIETDTNLYKIGDGVTAWNSIPYFGLREIDTSAILNFSNQNTPTPPSSNTLNVFARTLAGRMALRMQGPSGLSTPLQPSFFQNNIIIISPNTTSSLSTIGNSVTSTGTISHPSVNPIYGWMANIASVATVNSTCGTGTNATTVVRLTDTNLAGGFFFNARLAFPDSSYNESGTSTTGTRIFVGVTTETLANSVGSNNPSGSRFGFSRIHLNGGIVDTNWYITTRDGTVENRVNTGLPFISECVYDYFLFCPPDGSFIGWRIDNVTLNTTASGTETLNLPALNAFMRGGFQLFTANAITRNVRMQRIYIETDR